MTEVFKFDFVNGLHIRNMEVALTGSKDNNNCQVIMEYYNTDVDFISPAIGFLLTAVDNKEPVTVKWNYIEDQGYKVTMESKEIDSISFNINDEESSICFSKYEPESYNESLTA